MNIFWAMSAEMLAANMAAQRVIVHRLARIAEGGLAADREVRRMIVEKVAAQTEAGLLLLQGKPSLKAVQHVQSIVRANDRRLRKPKKRRKK
jgi:hypothetical protein